MFVLLAMLPRLLMAVPNGSFVCFAEGHVAVNCHETTYGVNCSSADSAESSALTGAANCLDLAAFPLQTQSYGSTSSLKLADFLAALVPYLSGMVEVAPPATAFTAVAIVVCPHFCARTFCCSIALRC